MNFNQNHEEQFLAEDEPFLEEDAQVNAASGTPFSELFPVDEEAELWQKVINGVQETCDFLFKNNWAGAYIFRDGETDRFFYKSLAKNQWKIERDWSKPFPLNVVLAPPPSKIPTPEETWALMQKTYDLGDQEMGKYIFIRNKNA